LLGIEVFEDDRDVIDAAANRVMSYLKDMAMGDDAAHSQTLLNEISRARICLLNKDKKAAYDEQLRQNLEAAGLHGERPMKPAAKKPPPKPSKAPGPPIAEPPSDSAPPPGVTPPPPLASSDPFPTLEAGPKKSAVGAPVSIVVERDEAKKKPKAESIASSPVADRDQEPRRESHRLLVVLAGLVAVAVVGFVVLLILFGGDDEPDLGQGVERDSTGKVEEPPVLVVRLSPQEREELTAFLLDGVPQQLPPEPQYVLPAGDHELVLRRNGFQEIKQTVKLVDGVRRDFRPRWRGETGSTSPSVPLPKLDPNFQSTAVDGFTSGYGRMVGHWKLDDDVKDESGSDLRATSVGDPVFVDGQTGQALRLAEQQRFEVAGPLFVDSSEFSMALWIRLDREPGTPEPILHGGELEIHLQGGLPKLRVRQLEPADGESTDELTRGFSGLDLGEHLNQWVHFALVYSAPAQQVHYYLNGEHQGYQRYTDFASAEMSRLEIGNIAADIDDLRIFDYRLSSVDVRTIIEGDFQPLLAAPGAPNNKLVCETWEDLPADLTRRRIERITVDAANETNVLSKGLWDLLGRPKRGSSLNRIRGFFYPPEDGDYVFLLRSSGCAMFYLQRFEPNEDSLAEVIVNDGARMESTPIKVEKDKAYYFELFHQYDDTTQGMCHFSLDCRPVGISKRRPFAKFDPGNRQKAIPAEYLASYGDAN